MWKALLRTDGDRATIVLRLALGIAIFPHGAQKLLGWFGGGGFGPTMEFFTSNLGVPAAFAFLVIVGESFGAVGLLLGFLTRIAAFGIGSIMVGAVFIGGNLRHGFFMNWSGQQAGEGVEYHILALGLALALLIKGGGAWSVDRALAPREEIPLRS